MIFPEITSMALQSDGKIVVAGIAFGQTSRDFFVARYNSDGTLDVSFGGGGGLLTDFGENTDDLAASVAVQPDGKIVVAGVQRPESSTGTFLDYDFAVARYTSGGVLDTSFGTGGVVTTDFGATADIAFSMAVQSDGKIVVAGSTVPDESLDLDFALARYNSAASSTPLSAQAASSPPTSTPRPLTSASAWHCSPTARSWWPVLPGSEDRQTSPSCATTAAARWTRALTATE